MASQLSLANPVLDAEASGPNYAHLQIVGNSAIRPSGGKVQDHVKASPKGPYFISSCPEMLRVRKLVEKIAAFDISVLILGETGTGKDHLAKLIHGRSSRAQRPFLKVNCAALPENLLESELFGYERGAFTGAFRTKPGQFEMCDGGTILLDEVAEMPAALQAKLLHVLQDGCFYRLGGHEPVSVDVRVLAATNANISEAINSQTLRQDLYYRLNAFTIQLPPLRSRTDEIPSLLEYFIKRFASDHGYAEIPSQKGSLMHVPGTTGRAIFVSCRVSFTVY